MQKTSETELVQQIRLAVSRIGCVVFRNNQGSFKDKNGRWVKFGVCNPGGSDLIGWTKDGKFLALEVKIEGKRPKPEQVTFVNAVRRAGGVAAIVYSVQDALDSINQPCNLVIPDM